MSGFVMKGALVELMPTFLPVPVPNVIIFQYNPETMTHTWAQPQPASSGGTEQSNPLAVKGMPGETFSFTIAVDSNDDIADQTLMAPVAQVSGVYSRLAALEMLLYPTGTTSAVASLVGTVSSAIGNALGGSPSAPSTSVPESVMPVTLFVWGAGRIVPVRVTGLSITEKLYDSALNPTHAEARLDLRVLTPDELTAASSDNQVLGNLATVAYTYTLTLREALAVANLGNAAQSVIGMLPH
ncbi:MAG TPA: hypothetical protein VMD59_15320 [Acidimicrobiales bacterium]|nr:hypothetical protein [Acidimicrobiales bacterium]